MGKVGQRWLKFTRRQRWRWSSFYETSLHFYFVLPKSKFSLVCAIFRTPTKSSWSHLLPMRSHGHASRQACHPCNLRSTSAEKKTCVLFILGSKGTSCYATHATHAAFPLGHLRPVYFRKQVHILLCHSRNLHDMSEESSGWHPTLLGREVSCYCCSNIWKSMYQSCPLAMGTICHWVNF